MRRTTAKPVAYGYIRLEASGLPARQAAGRLRARFLALCAREDLHLIRTVCDLGDDGSTITRPRLSRLLRDLAHAPPATVIVAHLDHLSPDELTRNSLLLTLHRAGHRVLVLTGPTNHPAH